MTNEEYIAQHRSDDVRQLALRRVPDGVDAKWCLQQIEGWQLAVRKLPHWAQTEGLWYPPRISMEQCSSEATAVYKSQIIERLVPSASGRAAMADLTGGFGVDFSYLAPAFAKARYFERQKELCRIANHNFALLDLADAEVVGADSADGSSWSDRDYTLIYVDPARRDGVGRKTVAIEDCVPDVTAMQHRLLSHAHFVMLKLSPMLDIRMALRKLSNVREVHVIAVRGECKELLLVMSAESAPLQIFCVNLETQDPPVLLNAEEAWRQRANLCDEMGLFLYEPSASLLKGAVQDAVAAQRGLLKLRRDSNLFTGSGLCADFPGRIFRVEAQCGFGKQELRQMLSGMEQANLTVRNFPVSVADLRKRLKLREGGSVYLFATTMADGSHILVRCSKVK